MYFGDIYIVNTFWILCLVPFFRSEQLPFKIPVHVPATHRNGLPLTKIKVIALLTALRNIQFPLGNFFYTHILFNNKNKGK